MLILNLLQTLTVQFMEYRQICVGKYKLTDRCDSKLTVECTDFLYIK